MVATSARIPGRVIAAVVVRPRSSGRGRHGCGRAGGGDRDVLDVGEGLDPVLGFWVARLYAHPVRQFRKKVGVSGNSAQRHERLLPRSRAVKRPGRLGAVDRTSNLG